MLLWGYSYRGFVLCSTPILETGSPLETCRRLDSSRTWQSHVEHIWTMTIEFARDKYRS